MNALANRIKERNDRRRAVVEWSLQPVNDNAPRNAIELLEAKISAQHAEISRLMHERNALPDDSDVENRLNEVFVALRAAQREYADRLRERYDLRRDLPSRQDSDDFKKAMELVEYYENHTPGHPTPDNNAHKGT